MRVADAKPYYDYNRIHQRKKYKRPEQEPEEDTNRMHVRIPMAVAADYDIAPQSTVRTDKSRGARVS